MRDVLAIQQDTSAGWPVESCEEFGNGGFTAAALADDAEELAPVEGERDIVYCLHAGVALVKMHRDVLVAQKAARITLAARRRGGVDGSGIFLCMISAVTAIMRCRIHFRNGCEQRPRVGVLRMFEHLRYRTLLDDPAPAHDGDAVGDVPYDTDVVRDEEECRACALLERAQCIEHLQLDGRVECRGRFVGEQQLRAQDDGESDSSALRHTA